jgi:hypothetical protein
MQLGYVGTNWYSVSKSQYDEARARNESPCAPGYALSIGPVGIDGQPQYYSCVKIADTGSGASNQPAPPINVTVSPSISSQVSPQISPAFQQQFQPSNSPASAGTSQVAPTNQNSAQTSSAPQAAAPMQSGYSAADVESLLRQQQAQYAAMLDQAMSAQASQPAPLPTMPAVNVDQSSPVPVAPVIPALPGGGTITPELTNAPASDNKAGILLALAGIVGLLAFRKGKK